MEDTVHPALTELVAEFIEHGHEATLDTEPNEQTGIPSYTLVVSVPNNRHFFYQVQAVEAPVPVFGARMFPETDAYYRVEAFTETGSKGEDLMGVTHDQIIEDVLARYESHLGFLTSLE